MSALGNFLRTRPRLAMAMALGCAATLALPASLGATARMLAGWNVTVWVYLCLMAWLMRQSTQARVRRLAEQEDRSAVAVLVIMSLAALVSLVAIVVELAGTRELTLTDRLLRYAFTGATVLGSWCLVGTLFTLHYARLYYGSPVGGRALRFPDGEEQPDYWDFLYLSFTIAVAAQTSDVSLMSRAMRKAVLAQSVLSFLFNVAIVGLSINIAASLVGG